MALKSLVYSIFFGQHCKQGQPPRCGCAKQNWKHQALQLKILPAQFSTIQLWDRIHLIAWMRSARVHGGSDTDGKFNERAGGPTNNVSSIGPSLSAGGCCAQRRPGGRGRFPRNVFQHEVNPKKRDNCLDLHNRNSRRCNCRICKLKVLFESASEIPQFFQLCWRVDLHFSSLQCAMVDAGLNQYVFQGWHVGRRVCSRWSRNNVPVWLHLTEEFVQFYWP